MSICRRRLWVPLFFACLLFLVACESPDPKHTAAQPQPQAIAPTTTTAPQPQVQAKTPPVDPVPGVIEKAEKLYQQGQADYKAGHLEAAKKDFNDAVDALMSSPVDVKSDDRLQAEFDKVVESVNQLEMQALQVGDGFTERKTEEAPIDEVNDVTFPVDPNVKAKATLELGSTHSDLPLVMNDEVASYINFFSTTRGHNTIVHGLERAGRYREMISRILKEEGVPQDLIYLAQAESGFHPTALSRAGARGMWQFIGARANAYGLERNWWVDERQDPEKATRAAARHLKDLYTQFGDWYLAMAAYNSGPGTVQAAVKRTGYADFWELYRRGVLPKETKNYVPIIVAETIMAKNPAQYGLADVIPEQPVPTDDVTIDYPVDLRLVSECVDVPVETLQDLNPSLLRNTTPKDGTFVLHLPAGTKDKYEQAIAAIPTDKRVLWHYHKVAAGETLADIAHKYKTTATAIADVNGIDTATGLAVDSKLIIPATTSANNDQLVFSKHPTRYRVRRGDTVLSVADDFGVPAEKLRRWNHIKGNDLHHRRSIVIYRPLDSRAQLAEAAHPRRGKHSKSANKTASKSKKQSDLAASTKIHKVQRGETLTSIAKRYGTTVEALRQENPKVASNLRAGDTLVVPTH
jgi:peptidoglycan lytic transglycosylase D